MVITSYFSNTDLFVVAVTITPCLGVFVANSTEIKAMSDTLDMIVLHIQPVASFEGFVDKCRYIILLFTTTVYPEV